MDAYFNAEKMRSPIHDQISEIQRKIQLLERDRSLQYESSKSLIEKNREKILQLRRENKLIHRKLAKALAADEQVIREAFQAHRSEMGAYRKMSGRAAVEVLDQKVCDKVKKLNAMKHMTNTQRHRLEELNAEYKSVIATSPGLLTDGVTMNKVDFADEQSQKNLCVLETQLEKAQLKCQETEHIIRSYQNLKEHVQEENQTFQSQMDDLECEVNQQKQELRYLQEMYKNVHEAKRQAKEELQSQKLIMCDEKRKQEIVLNSYKKYIEEQKAQSDRAERRAQMIALNTGKLSSEAQRCGPVEGEENKTFSSMKEAFNRIKGAMGVTDTQKLVDRFGSQCNTLALLEKMKLQNEHELQQLKEERDAIHTQYQDLKYSAGDTELIPDLTDGRMVLSQLEKEQQKLTHTMKCVEILVELLCYRLKHITLQDATLQPECVSPVCVLNLFQVAKLKLMQLQDELQGHDIPAVMKEIEELRASTERNRSDSSTSSTLLDNQIADLYKEEYDGEDDDDDDEVVTRMSLKQQSQFIIDSRKNNKHE
ncbi:outer dynein arm-docking complex subunit 3-like [Hemibagrus wyckioides]|uniref:outer dynein arm-docking complex subunit 3-like n=1 Tax=Hemibagrus wyckioides TaxID=337641 RepID=UPI00266D48C2|nr:outer dynein arm-docking complex subunit 3-like [Hemibagrus wyckioides]